MIADRCGNIDRYGYMYALPRELFAFTVTVTQCFIEIRVSELRYGYCVTVALAIDSDNPLTSPKII